MGSAPEASPEFRFEKEGNFQKKLLIKLFKKMKNLPKICKNLKNF